MDHPKNRSLAIDDILLGSIGANIPPSEIRDHAVRFLSTWSGTDKLMMASQYACKLLAPFLLYRAHLQFKAGKRAQPASLTTDGLYKFAGSVSVARRIMGFWGILGIMKGLSALERSPPASRLALNIGRLQGLSMIVFYPLEYISFFSAPFGGPLLRISPDAAMAAQLWSVRSWGVYVALKIVELWHEWTSLIQKESDATEDAHKAIQKRKRAVVYQLVANISRLPVIMHWSVIGGIYQSELWTSGLSLLSALSSFRGGWESSRVPGPMK
ncbi:hypothetical protein DFH08DRAFT_400978 [Mycena albidolilacea]|uniref:Uncharacterized protein n=1 Tax=Mycena albidolilacea TaxID=1033008 RepID=A0AAD6ZD00_9AGAR|nr:hypothetical protein DFH08DRAFT_400978 [Mycena albidolilacea]